MRRAPVALLLVATAFAPAHAAPVPSTVAAHYPNRYLPANVVAFEGQPMLFAQTDGEPHDLQSLDTDEHGTPLFWTGRPLRYGEVMKVPGVEALDPGPYAFFCNLHAGMWGQLEIRSN